jgi:D-threonate/D-erythronate kinase
VTLLILADDLTGACDAACAFGGARVVFDAPGCWPGVDVLAVDLDVRERSNEDARQAAAAAVRQLPAQRLYMKIDSTLRGPIAGLLDGALGSGVAVIAPAFPEQGRLFQDGRLNGSGPSVVEALGFEHTALLSAVAARSSDDVADAVEHARMRGARRVVVDTDGPDCLASIAEAWQRHADWVLVGSAGLARAVAGAAPVPAMDAESAGPVLVVAASPAAATHEQLRRMNAVGASEVIVLQSEQSHERDQGEVAARIANQACETARALRPRALVLTGGATARAVCLGLGVSGLALDGELQPGVAVGRLVGGELDGTRVVTKAGGFGGPSTLVDVVTALGVSSARGNAV